MYPEIILGSPGCGKTTTLLNIVEEEFSNGTSPSRLAYVTFTRKAAQEAISRATARFNYTRKQLPWFRTLHSLCFAVLGLSSNDVLERGKMAEFGAWAGYYIAPRGFGLDQDSYQGSDHGDKLLFLVNLATILGRPLREVYNDNDQGLFWHDVEYFSRALAKFKEDYGLLDYTDMLTHALKCPTLPQLDVLLVDESQDLSPLQWRVVERLAVGVRRVVVAGDDDQAIYRWAGADVDHFISMAGSVRVLEQSYRVPVQIQDLAQSVISRVYSRRPKVWAARGETGVVSWERLESVDFSGDDVLVLSRNTNLLKRYVAPILKERGVLFEFKGFSSVNATVLGAVAGWEKLRRGERLLIADVREIYEYLPIDEGIQRGFKRLTGFREDDEVDIHDLVLRGGLLTDKIWHEALTRLPLAERGYLLEALRNGEKITARPRIRLSTIHTAKGGEADHVVLLTDMARKTYKERDRFPDDEARVWYVGITRAKKKITLVEPLTARNYRL